MRLLISAGTALAVAIVTLGPIGLAAPRPRNINVIVTLRDAATDRIQSDGLGPYVDGAAGAGGYIAGDNGALIWGTHTNGTTVRTLRFFFTDCLVPPCAPPSSWPQPLDEPAGMQLNALRAGQVPAGGLLGMTIGDDWDAWIKMNIPVDSDPAYFNVCFDARKVVGPCGLAPSATSTNARIRREAQDRWTLWADATDRADLIRDSQSKRSRTYTVLGTYSMPFSLTVQCLDVNSAGDCV